MTYPIDPRTLNPGETYLHATLGERRVLRIRQAGIGYTEVLHCRPDQPGETAYSLYPHGTTIQVLFK